MIMAMPSIDTSLVKVFGPASGYTYVGEDEFFEKRKRILEETGSVPDAGNCIPLPAAIRRWDIGRIGDTDCLVSFDEYNLYALIETSNFGFALCHWVPKDDGPANEYKFCAKNPFRPISERSNVKMANLSEVARRNRLHTRAAQTMDLGGGTEEMTVPSVEPTGLTTGVEARLLHKTAQSHGYVFGYVMCNAPQTTMGVQRKKQPNGGKSATLTAKQSKPSRILSVLMALPKKCVMKNGVMASPQEIDVRNIDWDSYDEDDLVVTAMPQNVAVAYMFVLGGSLPEYAPNVSNATEQWTKEQILTEAPGVNFVYANAVKSKRAETGRFNYTLKTTASRRTLFTSGNHVCLRAVVHEKIPSGDLTEERAYELNRSAFGHLSYRMHTQHKVDLLTSTIADCPTQIWRKKYIINGKEVDGIGSCFFMAGKEDVNDSGTKILRTPVEVVPWDATGDKVAVPCHAIVKRVLKPADGEKKERMVTERLTLEKNADHQMFRPYQAFIRKATDAGYLTYDKLINMDRGRSAKKSYQMSAEAIQDMTSQIRGNMELLSDIEAVMNNVTTSVLIGN